MMTNAQRELAAICYSHFADHEAAEQALDELLQNERFALAYHLVSEGFSVLPLCRDGKRPTRRWKELQSRRPTVFELMVWFVDNDFTPGIITGELSGITVIDCDSADAIAECCERELKSPMNQQTKRGLHFVFQWNGERNTVRVDGMQGVDRRGEGGYVKAYPDSRYWTREQVELAPII